MTVKKGLKVLNIFIKQSEEQLIKIIKWERENDDESWRIPKIMRSNLEWDIEILKYVQKQITPKSKKINSKIKKSRI